MANNCLFDMKITGPEENVRTMVQMLKNKHPTASIDLFMERSDLNGSN